MSNTNKRNILVGLAYLFLLKFLITKCYPSIFYGIYKPIWSRSIFWCINVGNSNGIHYVIDFNDFPCKKEEHNIFQFISAGNLIERKGFDNVIIAFAKLISKGINANLKIMGDGPEKDYLKELVQKYGINNNVNFFGAYTRLQFAKELAISDCFVMASRRETFGVVYAEALACGVPVIATRCGGPTDFVNDSNGILVDVDDIDALFAALENMFFHSKDYNSNQIALEAVNTFSPNTIARLIENVFVDRLEYNRK